MTVVTAAVGLIFLGFLVWAVKSGQFKNVEDAKYQVFRKQKPSPKDEPDKTGGRESEVENHAA
jgi:nitrogen fixation-related uncharacterized protein